MRSSLPILTCLAVLAPAVGLCDDAPPPPPKNVWTGKGQVGYVASQGNTRAQSANAQLDMTYTTDDWEHSAHAGGLYAKSGDIVSGERWDARWQSSYSFTKSLYTFGALRYERDLFSGFQYQESASIGVGVKIIDTDSTHLSLQAGPGIRRERPQVLVTDADGRVTERLPGDAKDSGILSAGLDYSQVLSPTTSLTNKLLVESGGGNTLYTDQLAITLKASTRLAVSLGYSIQDNTAPPAGEKKLDTTETVNLVYSF